MSEQNREHKGLADAPKQVQLAVDLIQLLEENQVEVCVALEALEIVLSDFKRKQLDMLKNK